MGRLALEDVQILFNFIFVGGKTLVFQCVMWCVSYEMGVFLLQNGLLVATDGAEISYQVGGI